MNGNTWKSTVRVKTDTADQNIVSARYQNFLLLSYVILRGQVYPFLG
ncbi:hypothetical protein CSB67_5290 (plasmid) [Enterobacter hormaechei]|nr:hypothetical protein CSB67_5290 [Enterobacter hormaechei]